MPKDMKPCQCSFSIQTGGQIYIVSIDVMPMHWQADAGALVNANLSTAEWTTTVEENGDFRIQLELLLKV
jgi:hypothetical protein